MLRCITMVLLRFITIFVLPPKSTYPSSPPLPMNDNDARWTLHPPSLLELWCRRERMQSRIISLAILLAEGIVCRAVFARPVYRMAIHLNGSHSTSELLDALNDSRVDFLAFELHRLQSHLLVEATKRSPGGLGNPSLRGMDISCNWYTCSHTIH